jgi:DNA polymerase-3 subunit delta
MSDTPSVLLFHGNDEFAISAALDGLEAALGDPSNAAMNLSRLDGRAGVDFETLNTAVNALPFLSPRRLVIFRHPTAAFSSADGRKKFLAFLEAVPPTTTLALVESEALRADAWLLKWAQRAGPRAEARAFSMPKRRDLPGWIVQEAKKQGGAIDPAAAAALAEMTGEDTRIAAQEIAKLLTYVNYARAIGVKDVEQVSVLSAQGSVFDLVDALGSGDGRKAQHTLRRLLEDQEPFELWGMIIRQFRLLLLAREILDGRGGPLEVQQALGLHEFVAGTIAVQARRFSMASLEKIYHRLLAIDEGAKTSQVPLDLALDTLIVELTAPQA